MERDDEAMEPFREVNLSDGKCNVSLYVCAEEEKKIDEDPEYASELFKAALEGRLPSACDESETEGSDNGNEETSKSEKNSTAEEVEWDSDATQAFVNVLKKNTKWLPLNKAGTRKQLFLKVKHDLVLEGYNFSLESVRAKFNSLVHTYRRIKFKSKQDGVVSTKWQFFEVFDGIMKASESSKLKLKDPDLLEVKVEPEAVIANNSLVGLSNELLTSPPQIQSGSSGTISREASPERPKKQGSSKKKISKAPLTNPASKKRKRRELDPLETAGPSSNSENTMKGLEHIIVGSEGFNHAATLLFIDCIKKHKDLLRKKKSPEMFLEIKQEMAKEGFSFTEAKLRKKWYNLLISYRRILERANETGDLISSWPYYEAIDSIIVDTKDLAQKKKEEVNGCGDYPEATTSNAYKNHSSGYLGTEKGDGIGDDVGENRLSDTDKGSSSSKGYLTIDFLRLNNCLPNDKHGANDRDFQRSLLEEWEKREKRQEERDKIKLEVLKEIAQSLSIMSCKQDELLELLKNLK
ncbi:uncharacterized protein LOC135213161 isoform X1 [Macrobrachium nipponense]|uniref:uncharacterized protein LOC135213161 isoform X1 n=1 Tax=Macrobrachium nipponense TaxID=159736 RepID=UPI0030C86FA6